MAAKSSARLPIPLKRTPFSRFSAVQPNPTPPSLIPSSAYHTNPFVFRNLDAALNVFDNTLRLNPMPSVRIYNKLLNSIVKMQHYSQVVILFNKMTLSGCPINEYTRNIVINCCCRLKRVDLGFAVVATFLKRGYAPNVVTMNCLIKGLFFEGKVVEAAELFRNAIRENLCEVRKFTTSLVLDGLCKSGNLVNAVQLLGDLENVNVKLNSYGYTTVIDGLCKSRMVDDALALLSKMIERGFVPDVGTYTALIQGLCDFRRLDEAKKLLKQMVDNKVRPDVGTFTTLVDCYCKERLLNDAEDVVEIMKQWDVKPNVESYNALMDGYSLQGQLDKAVEVLNLMIGMGLQPDVETCTALIEGLCQEGLFQEAEEMLDKMLQSGCCPNIVTYKQIVEDCLKQHDSSGSINLLETDC